MANDSLGHQHSFILSIGRWDLLVGREILSNQSAEAGQKERIKKELVALMKEGITVKLTKGRDQIIIKKAENETGSITVTKGVARGDEAAQLIGEDFVAFRPNTIGRNIPSQECLEKKIPSNLETRLFIAGREIEIAENIPDRCYFFFAELVRKHRAFHLKNLFLNTDFFPDDLLSLDRKSRQV
ncbi:MAG: hypothetical protein IKE64_07225 [Thermoguttaceae bacterium]|nr:hypothetical protein [Thermoguttaceae bacterium]